MAMHAKGQPGSPGPTGPGYLADDPSPTLGGPLNGQGETAHNLHQALNNLGVAPATVTVDFAGPGHLVAELFSVTDIAFDNLPYGKVGRVTADFIGGSDYAINWPSNVVFYAGSAPAFAPGDNATRLAFSCYDGRTVYVGVVEPSFARQANLIRNGFSVSRASGKAYLDSAGHLQIAADNVPTYEWDAATGLALGLGGHKGSTNIFSWSEDLTNGVWSAAMVSVGPSAIAPPMGRTWQKITESSDVTPQYHAVQRWIGSFVAGRTYTLTWRVAAEGRDQLQLMFDAASFGAHVCWKFDLTAETSTRVTSGTNDIGRIKPLGGDVYEVSLTADAVTTGGGLVRVWLLGDDGSNPYIGDGVSGIAGGLAQLEEGTGPSPYIPTTTAPLSRAPDALSAVVSTGATGWFRVAGRWVHTPTQTEALAVYKDSLDTTNYLSLHRWPGEPGNIDLGVRVAGAGPYLTLKTDYQNGDLVKVCASWDGSNIIASVNGQPHQSMASATPLFDKLSAFTAPWSDVVNSSGYLLDFQQGPEALSSDLVEAMAA